MPVQAPCLPIEFMDNQAQFRAAVAHAQTHVEVVDLASRYVGAHEPAAIDSMALLDIVSTAHDRIRRTHQATVENFYRTLRPETQPYYAKPAPSLPAHPGGCGSTAGA